VYEAAIHMREVLALRALWWLLVAAALQATPGSVQLYCYVINSCLRLSIKR